MQAVTTTPFSRSQFQTVIQQILRTGKITQEAKQQLLAASRWETPLTVEELAAVQAVATRLQMGFVRVVD
ncbi:hypothetical protein [Trichothermofontia sp.]